MDRKTANTHIDDFTSEYANFYLERIKVDSSFNNLNNVQLYEATIPFVTNFLSKLSHHLRYYGKHYYDLDQTTKNYFTTLHIYISLKYEIKKNLFISSFDDLDSFSDDFKDEVLSLRNYFYKFENVPNLTSRILEFCNNNCQKVMYYFKDHYKEYLEPNINLIDLYLSYKSVYSNIRETLLKLCTYKKENDYLDFVLLNRYQVLIDSVNKEIPYEEMKSVSAEYIKSKKYRDEFLILYKSYLNTLRFNTMSYLYYFPALLRLININNYIVSQIFVTVYRNLEGSLTKLQYQKEIEEVNTFEEMLPIIEKYFPQRLEKIFKKDFNIQDENDKFLILESNINAWIQKRKIKSEKYKMLIAKIIEMCKKSTWI